MGYESCSKCSCIIKRGKEKMCCSNNYCNDCYSNHCIEYHDYNDDDFDIDTAIILYEVYCKEVDNIAVNNDKLAYASEFFYNKKFNKQANAWKKVARFVIDHF